MATEIEITNLALSKIGEDAINSFTDDSTAARLARLAYGPGRDAVLRDHFWNFAMKRAALTALVDAPAWGFPLQYELPSDFIRLKQIEGARRPEDFQLEGGRILTDLSSPINILYVCRFTTAEKFDPLFVDALATYLAAEWAERITGSVTLREELTRLYSLKLQQARSMDGQENPPVVLAACDWINARF